jgi:ATP-dependent Lon protease
MITAGDRRGDDLPESVRGELQVHSVSDVAEVLELALEPAPLSAAA